MKMSEGTSKTNRVLCRAKDIEEQYGIHRRDAAASLKISESSIWRASKKLGIKKRRPYTQRKKSSKAKNKTASSIEPQMEENVLIRQATDDDDGVDHMGAQPSLDSAKLLFNNLIALPMQEISDPVNETSMKNALTILENNLKLFSKEPPHYILPGFSKQQAGQILHLVFDFPVLVGSWREYNSRYQAYNNLKLLDEVEKIRELVKTLEIEEESLKVRYENKEKELRQLLGAVEREKAEIPEEMIQKSKGPHQSKAERLLRIATAKLNSLSNEWDKLRSPFI